MKKLVSSLAATLTLIGGCSTNAEWCCATYDRAYYSPTTKVDEPDFISKIGDIGECGSIEHGNDLPATMTLPYAHFRSQNRPMAVLQNDLTVRVELEHEITRDRYAVYVKAPKHFVTDFTSRPVGSGLFVSNYGRHIKGSIIHDWLYAVGFPRELGGEKFADQVFFQTIRDAGEHALGRFMIMTPLRIWPGSNYRGNRERIFWVADNRFVEQGYLYGVSLDKAEELRSKSVRICPLGGANLDINEIDENELRELLTNLKGTGMRENER